MGAQAIWSVSRPSCIFGLFLLLSRFHTCDKLAHIRYFSCDLVVMDPLVYEQKGFIRYRRIFRRKRNNMEKRRALLLSVILALALICIPVAAIGTSGMLSQLASHSRMNSLLSGYSPGTGGTTDLPAIPAPDSSSGTQASASERIASLLSSDIGNWQPPEGWAYDLPDHTPTEREEYTALAIPVFTRSCSTCGESSGFFS